MNPIKNLFKFNRRKVKSQTNFIGRTSIGAVNPGRMMGLDLHSDTYASAYPSIRAIANEYMTVLPKAIDGNGKPVKSNILDALYHPNQLDSVVSFNEKIATSTLVLPQTYLLVWRSEGGVAKPGGDFGFKGRNIAGFTFLENPGVSRRDGKTYYNVGSQWFTEDEVIVLDGGVDPHNLYGGYSPTEAACRWITLDDYIADFQKGFFENNAIPAGMFKISAATPTEFEDIVTNLKRRHKGAGNNNNVTYSHAPVDPATGKVAEAKIEWIPFQQSNKDIDFKSLFEQANHRIDQAYGVPAIVKGIDDAATYANAQVAEAGFAKRAVLPLLTRNYAQITHELNRITGGMGIAITFDYEIPAVADEEKVVAETHVVHANLLNSLELNGYSLDSIVDAFDLPKRIKLLKKGDQAAVIENDKPQVDEGGEVESSPDPENIDGVQPLNNSKIQVKNQISSRDYPDLYEGTDVDPSDLGCIMLDVKPLEILSLVDGGEKDLVEVTDRHDHQMGAVAEIEPHVTLLYGLLENGNVWKDKVDTVLDDWKLDTVKIEDVSYFNLPDSYAVIAHIEKTTDLLDGHNRLTLLPHINTFSTYKPHMTLAYIKKEADLGKWLTSLNEQYAGKELKVTGLNYGDLPEEDDSDDSSPKNKVEKELHCQACDRFLGVTTQASYTDKLKCSNSKCKALEVPTVKEAAKADTLKAQLTPSDEELYRTQLESVTRDFMRAEVDRAISAVDSPQSATEQELEDFLDNAMVTITSILVASGALEYSEGIALLISSGLSADGTSYFQLSDTQIDRYRKYLKNVGESYSSDTQASIQAVLDRANVDGWTAQELKAELRNIMDTDEYRVKRLARSEVNRSQQTASVYGMEQIQEETDIKFNKVWTVNNPSACSGCRALDGKVVATSESFLKVGESITGDDGKVYTNDFVAMEEAQLHPNDTCNLTWQVA